MRAKAEQSRNEVFALDIGTRSIIGIVGRMEEGRFHVLALEKENHDQRAMLDGQIEDIDRVAEVAAVVRKRLEARLQMKLKHVCVAAAGRALQSERGTFALEFETPQRITDEMINQLEAGAVSDAERSLIAGTQQRYERFYMVGYSVTRYESDGYPLSSLRDHNGLRFEAEVMATYLPQEVVESLYAVVGKLGLEVASLTLEPIASLNAAIPADIRLLNLVLVDIGAGTSDIAICREGSVVGYTMATVAGDEITEQLMRKYLVDFQTAEQIKQDMGNSKHVVFEDILGIEHNVQIKELWTVIEPESKKLAGEIARRIMEINGKAPSAVFLAGGGSKLHGLGNLVASELKIDPSRIAIAGHHFARSAYAEDYKLDDPEYSTPLGIAISAAMGLINDSYVVLLNGKPAKLFRSGTLVVRDILLMNGYRYGDLIGKTGANLTVMVNGERRFFRGRPAVPPIITVNGELAELSTVIHAGDELEFAPARPGKDAPRRLRDILGESFQGGILVNGVAARPDDLVNTGDEIWAEDLTREDPLLDERTFVATEGAAAAAPKGNGESRPDAKAEKAPPAPGKPPAPAKQPAPPLAITLNGATLQLPGKETGEPYYLMDLLEHSGLDLDNLEKPVELMVNGFEGLFSQIMHTGDNVSIHYKED